MTTLDRYLVLVIILLIGFSPEPTEAFVKGSPRVNSRPLAIESKTCLAVAKKKAPATKKKAAPKAKSKSKVASTQPPKAPKEKIEGEAMKKAELVASIAERMSCTKVDAEKALTAVMGTVQDNVLAGKKVSLAGFGSFQLRARAARKGRNPQTGEEISIAARKTPTFTVAKAFKDAANE